MERNKTASIDDRLKALKGAGKTVAIEIKEIKKPDGRKNNGGRPGMGRKPLALDEKRVTLKRSWEHFAEEQDEVLVTRLEQGTKVQRKEKMNRLRVIQEAVYKAAKHGDMAAAKEFNNRVHGHPKQPIVGDDDEPPVQVDLGAGRILDKAYGTDEESD